MVNEIMNFRTSRFAFLAALLLLPPVGSAAPSKSTNAIAPQEVRSVFVMPNSPAEGRDPFYPNATSLYHIQSSGPAVPHTPGIDLLKLVGILGNSLATINGVTFGVGETQDVKTTSGPVSVRLLSIKPQDESVLIEANGIRRELKVGGGGLTGRP